MDNNIYWDNVNKMALKQRGKGLVKYGVGLEGNTTLGFEERIVHLQEELIDALMYCEHLKVLFREKEKQDEDNN